MSSESLPAHAIAQYDQALRECEELLADMITVYRTMRKAQADQGLAEAVTVVGCAEWLAEQVTHEACASALAVAILAFERSTPDE